MYDKRGITSITTWIAALVGVAVTLLLPLGYFTVSYKHLTGSLEAEAELTSLIITRLINTNPDLWQYEQLRLEEAMRRWTQDHHTETRRVFDRQNRLVAEVVTPLEPPLITRRVDLLDAGTPVGTIEISSSLYSLMFRSGLAALLGLSCGVVIFVTLRVLPLRAVAVAERSLRESEERYRRLVENAPDAILVYGNGGFLYANNAAVRLFGAEHAGQLIGQPFLSIVHPDSRKQAEGGLHVAEDTDTAAPHQELKLVRSDGTPVEVEAVGIRITYKEEAAVQVIMHDITERTRLQHALTDEVRLLEAALAKVKQLEGIIPICMFCKKIRDDKESWQQLESYITTHSEAEFSHGICPECLAKAANGSLQGEGRAHRR